MKWFVICIYHLEYSYFMVGIWNLSFQPDINQNVLYCIVCYIGSSGNPTGPHLYINAYSMMSKQYQKTFNRLATTSECGIINGTALLPSVKLYLLYKTASEAVKSKDSVPLGWNAAGLGNQFLMSQRTRVTPEYQEPITATRCRIPQKNGILNHTAEKPQNSLCKITQKHPEMNIMTARFSSASQYRLSLAKAWTDLWEQCDNFHTQSVASSPVGGANNTNTHLTFNY